MSTIALHTRPEICCYPTNLYIFNFIRPNISRNVRVRPNALPITAVDGVRDEYIFTSELGVSYVENAVLRLEYKRTDPVAQKNRIVRCVLRTFRRNLFIIFNGKTLKSITKKNNKYARKKSHRACNVPVMFTVLLFTDRYRYSCIIYSYCYLL